MENILTTEKSEDYELLDTGNGEKLERYGSVVLVRPDNQAIWRKTKLEEVWAEANASFTHGEKAGRWKINKDFEKPWSIKLFDLNFSLDLLPSKHLGVFPEQVENWKWLYEKAKKEIDSHKTIKAINFFGYTGGASLALAKAGAEVVHVDASKFAVDKAFQNLNNSGLGDKKIRFIVDDVRKFLEREINRGNKYDIIILDPPVYGKGSKKEVWRIEEELAPFLEKVTKILSEKPIAILLNGYASLYSHLTYKEVLSSSFKNYFSTITSGELCLKESSGDRLLPCGIYARCEN
jgi:23S rRNA (cytosine1962-C5)-methyltransferase